MSRHAFRHFGALGNPGNDACAFPILVNEKQTQELLTLFVILNADCMQHSDHHSCKADVSEDRFIDPVLMMSISQSISGLLYKIMYALCL